MLERYIQRLSVADVGLEEPSTTRERLKDRFARGATRRMTQLGMLIGTALDDIEPEADDAVVYASAYGESRALEGYLDSFPGASPTLFQTSIHPSAVQQALIGRQQPIREFFPMTGRAHLPAHALQAAALCGASRVLFCGGEERGTWLLESTVASDRCFAFALALTGNPAAAIARIQLWMTEEPAVEFTLPMFFDALVARRSINCIAGPGTRLIVEWL